MNPFTILPRLKTRLFQLLGGRFQSSYTCSSNSKNWTTLRLSLVDCIGSFFWNCIPFFMHLMIFNLIFTHRKESSKTNMQSYKMTFNSSLIQTFQHFFCKMQTCCRTSCRTSLICINILIAFRVFFCITTFNVWWKRNMTVTFKPVFINCKIKLHCTEFSTGISRNINYSTNCSIRKFIMHTRLLFFGRFYHCIPDCTFFINRIQKHKFLLTTCSFFYTINTGTTYSGIIKNH